MANSLQQFIQPAIDAQVEKALSAKQPVAYSAGAMPEASLGKSIGQPHDADYALLYALYTFNTDFSGCIHKRASRQGVSLLLATQ